MKNSPHRRNHLKEKAIREANAIQDSGPLPDKMIEHPQFKEQFIAKKEELPHKIKKQHKQTSKRTSTKEVKYPTEQSSVHHENDKWNKTLQAQTKEKNLLLNKKLSKNGKK